MTEREEVRKIISHPSHRDLMHTCDRLWSYAVKARARHQSQLSGNIVELQSHHIFKKPNLALRYDLSNGICVTSNEHAMIHSNMRLWEPRIRSVIGVGEWSRLQSLRFSCQKVNLMDVKERLIKAIDEVENIA